MTAHAAGLRRLGPGFSVAFGGNEGGGADVFGRKITLFKLAGFTVRADVS